MYDVEFVVPVCSTGKYLKRALNLPKYSLVNNQNKNTLVTLLLGPNDNFSDLDGWEPGITVRGCVHDSDWAAQKIYQYYTNGCSPHTARWNIKIDDDTCTDISGLIDNLDDQYDHRYPYYVVGELIRPGKEHVIDWELFEKLGYSSHTTIYSEREASAVSAATLTEIYANPTAKEMLKLRSQYTGGYGDVALSMAARICKIHAVKADFISTQPYFHHFSLWGGRFNHVHFTYYSERITTFWETRMLIKDEDKQFEGRYFLLSDQKTKDCVIQLNADRSVYCLNNKARIAIWCLVEDKLYIYTGQTSPVFVFEVRDGKWLDPELSASIREITSDQIINLGTYV